MFKILGAALVVAFAFGAAASAATLSGTFSVTAVNVTKVDSSQSRARLSNIDAALAGTIGKSVESDTFTYVGAIDFGTFDEKDGTTISQWLATGTPDGVSGLDEDFGKLQLSKPNIRDGKATTTFFRFTLQTIMPAADFIVEHDDGFAIFDGETRVGGVDGPTAVRTTEVLGFDGGTLSILYVATNGDPSVLNVQAVNVVPVPAALPLLLAGLGGLALLKRRKTA